MSEQPSSLYNTITSYIPGFGGGEQTEEQQKSQQSDQFGGNLQSERHRGQNPTEGSSEFGQHSQGQGQTGKYSQTGQNQAVDTDAGYGARRDVQYEDDYPTKNKESEGNAQDPTNSGFGHFGSEPGTGTGLNQGGAGGQNTQTEFGKKYGNFQSGSGSGSQDGGSNESTGIRSQGGGSVGSGNQSSEGFQGSFQRDDGVRGAPIEGENLKGYAIGAPVGSGDTANPRAPNDPTGQVSGSHLQYGPVHSDNRDTTGKGTHETTKGEGDSSFANVRKDDGRGNSEHVVTKSSKSTMSSTSTTQL